MFFRIKMKKQKTMANPMILFVAWNNLIDTHGSHPRIFIFLALKNFLFSKFFSKKLAVFGQWFN